MEPVGQIDEQDVPIRMLMPFLTPLGHAEVRAAMFGLRAQQAEARAQFAEQELAEARDAEQPVALRAT